MFLVFFVLEVLLLGCAPARGFLGLDTYSAISVDTWECLKNLGFYYVIQRGYQSLGQNDPNAISSLENARSAGFQYLDFYMFPCRGLGAADQMQEFVEYLQASGWEAGVDYQYIWLDLESNPKLSCYWSSHSSESNCDYVKDLIAAGEALGLNIGLYSSYYNWDLIFGSPTGCPDFTDYPIWYAHYDDEASFDDWNDLAFGGWDVPSIKQYQGDVVLCSTDTDTNWAPQSFFDSYYGGGGSSAECTGSNTPLTAGGVSVTFPSGTSLTSAENCDDNYNDPNEMGMYLFSKSAVGTSTYLSDNFQVSEFVSPDGDDYFRLSPVLVECVQAVREDIAEAVFIKESYRTVEYNQDVNGASSSRHLAGTAADIYASSASILTVAESAICKCASIFEDNGYGIGLGLDAEFVHVDMRETDASWVEDGAEYTSSEWSSYISTTANSCGVTGVTLDDDDDDDTDGSTGNVNADGTIRFPNANLSPISSSDSNYNDPNYSGTSLFSKSASGSSTYLSDNFAVSEFTSNDGADGFRLAPELVECLQAVREDLGVSINVNSGYRTVYWNNYWNGASYSRHLSGTAADIQQYSVGHFTFADSVICNCRALFLNAGQEVGLGLGGSYLHVDMRPNHGFWIYSGAALTEAAWGSYIASVWSSCPQKYSTSSIIVSAAENYEFVNDNDMYEYQTVDDIDNDEYVDTSDGSESDADGADDGGKNEGLQWWVILIIVVAVLTVVVIGVVCFVKRKRSNVNQNEENITTGYVPVAAE